MAREEKYTKKEKNVNVTVMTADVLEVLEKQGLGADWPLDSEGLPISRWFDKTPTGLKLCSSVSGTLARMEIFMKRRALLAFDPQI